MFDARLGPRGWVRQRGPALNIWVKRAAEAQFFWLGATWSSRGALAVAPNVGVYDPVISRLATHLSANEDVAAGHAPAICERVGSFDPARPGAYQVERFGAPERLVDAVLEVVEEHALPSLRRHLGQASLLSLAERGQHCLAQPRELRLLHRFALACALRNAEALATAASELRELLEPYRGRFPKKTIEDDLYLRTYLGAIDRARAVLDAGALPRVVVDQAARDERRLLDRFSEH